MAVKEFVPLAEYAARNWELATEGSPIATERANPLPSAVRTEDIIALHEEGLTPSEIATRLNASYFVVYQRLKKAGIKPHPTKPLPVKTEDIIALHEEGLSPPEIAARLNVSRSLIDHRLRRAGLKPILSPMYVKAAERTSDIIRLHGEGYSPEEIAKEIGLKPGWVSHRLREARLAPHPSAEEARNAVQALNEIVRLEKEGVPRYEIAKRTGTTWSLVAQALDRSSVRPVVPASEEFATWASRLLPLIDEIREAYPDTEPVLAKVDQLEKELGAISDATWAAQQSLPWRGREAEEERWSIAPISQAVTSSLDYVDALRGCVEQLDVAKLPKKLEQAEVCILNICNVMGGAVSQVTEKEGGSMEERRRGEPRSDAERAIAHYGITDEEYYAHPEKYPLPERGAGFETGRAAGLSSGVKAIAEEAAIKAVSMSKEMSGDNPISPHCERVLEEPPLCYDFRGIRSYVMCKAWDLMEKQKLTRLPVGEAWAEARGVCRMA